MVTNSVVVFVVREGNPKGIRTWNDLLKPGVEVITPNPFTSGGARWNVMAAYGAQRKHGKTHEQARRLPARAVPPRARAGQERARVAADLLGGKGDVLLAYENEAIFAQKKGQPIEYIVPDATILIENPIAVDDRAAHPREAKAFVKCLRTPEAQKIFARERLPPGRRRACGDSSRVPDAGRAVHDRRRRRLGERADGVLRPRRRDHRQDRARARWQQRRLTAQHVALARPAAGARLAAKRRPRPRHRLPEPDRPAPARCRRLAVDARAAAAFWDAVTTPEAVRR